MKFTYDALQYYASKSDLPDTYKPKNYAVMIIEFFTSISSDSSIVPNDIRTFSIIHITLSLQKIRLW